MANALIERIEEGLRETGGTLMDTKKVQDLLLDILIEARKVEMVDEPVAIAHVTVDEQGEFHPLP